MRRTLLLCGLLSAAALIAPARLHGRARRPRGGRAAARRAPRASSSPEPPRPDGEGGSNPIKESIEAGRRLRREIGQTVGAVARTVIGEDVETAAAARARLLDCLLYTSPSPRDGLLSRMPSSA